MCPLLKMTTIKAYGALGFLMLEPVHSECGFTGEDTDYPDLWLEETRAGELRLKATYRKTKAEVVTVRPDGICGSGGRRAWFMPGKFKFCAACGDHHSDSTRDINRLAALSAEGRSSATTIIIGAILRWMNEATNDIPASTRKLLAFTDNRRDAALQAGHFNDFIFVTLLRGAILAALTKVKEEGLQDDLVRQAICAGENYHHGLRSILCKIRANQTISIAPTVNILLIHKASVISVTRAYWNVFRYAFSPGVTLLSECAAGDTGRGHCPCVLVRPRSWISTVCRRGIGFVMRGSATTAGSCR